MSKYFFLSLLPPPDVLSNRRENAKFLYDVLADLEKDAVSGSVLSEQLKASKDKVKKKPKRISTQQAVRVLFGYIIYTIVNIVQVQAQMKAVEAEATYLSKKDQFKLMGINLNFDGYEEGFQGQDMKKSTLMSRIRTLKGTMNDIDTYGRIARYQMGAMLIGGSKVLLHWKLKTIDVLIHINVGFSTSNRVSQRSS